MDYQLLSHLSRLSRRSVGPSKFFLSSANFCVASSRLFSVSMSFITTQSPFSLRYVWFKSSAVGSPFTKLMGVIFMRCLIFHRRALFSGMFFTTETFGFCWRALNNYKIKDPLQLHKLTSINPKSRRSLRSQYGFPLTLFTREMRNILGGVTSSTGSAVSSPFLQD